MLVLFANCVGGFDIGRFLLLGMGSFLRVWVYSFLEIVFVWVGMRSFEMDWLFLGIGLGVLNYFLQVLLGVRDSVYGVVSVY